jgi:FAD:protein FMN transferase
MMTTTAFSTPTNRSEPAWQSLRKEVRKEIMNTDVLCELLFQEGQEGQSTTSLEEAFTLMRTFADRYSRFRADNALATFNQSERSHLSPEFFDILNRARSFHALTDGLFDPSILQALEQEGYVGALPPQPSLLKQISFSELRLDQETLTASKPKDLLIDLGGIGKGYIIDRVADMLSLHFEHFLIDAGGDIRVKGVNKKEGYPYWAIEVEHPHSSEKPAALLLLHDMAVATSGRNRRHWKQDGEEKHHLIDPRTKRSASRDYLSVTVIAEDAVTADVLAKALFIAGKERAPLLATQWNTPAIFITDSGQVIINQQAQAYVWKTS